MTVARPAGPETVRGIRFCEQDRRIAMFQPEPPPGFRRMIGVWTFTEETGRTRVTAERWFELLPGRGLSVEEAHRVTAEKLRGYLRTNLGLFRASLEAPR
jgi:hypothetical protein